MSRARERLAAHAAAAGYPTSLLTTIAQATLPRHAAGERLDDRQIKHITAAVQTLAEAGISHTQLPGLVAEHQRRHGEHWRERLWAHVLATANTRLANPERHRPSPSETPPPAHPNGTRPVTPRRAA
jgi:hypothetical protein